MGFGLDHFELLTIYFNYEINLKEYTKLHSTIRTWAWKTMLYVHIDRMIKKVKGPLLSLRQFLTTENPLESPLAPTPQRVL